MEQQPDPTPDEIRQACAEIRAGWTDSERQARLAKLPPLQDCDFASVEAKAMAERQRLSALHRGDGVAF